MTLPNGANAVIEIDKLRRYCLNSAHPRGKHKARVFASALGLTAENAELLHAALQEAARTNETSPREDDEFGQRFIVDFEMRTAAGSAINRSKWIIRRGEDFPRFSSYYVL